MSNIQMLLALGALFILSLLIINLSKNTLLTEDVFYDCNFGILATSLASSVIEDASKKHFDEKSDTIHIDKTSELTVSSSLGNDPDEPADQPKYFNDIDDYNGYSAVDSSMPSAVFNINCSVGYVNPADPDKIVSTPTWHKKITVRVTSQSMRDTIYQSSVFSYWNFR